MECKRVFLFLAVIVGQASAARTLARRTMLLGGYLPIANPEEPYVQSVARFAVSEHDKEVSDDLAFVAVVSGEQQEVDGVNYKLVVAAIDGDDTERNYLVEVFVSLSRDHKKLTSFQLLDSRRN